MLWTIRHFPPCSHHVFLSHSREDRADLVDPIYLQLREQRIVPWLDRHDYAYGRDSRIALQDGILRSRHVVFLITLNLLNSPRGWCALELAYASILQNNLNCTGGSLATVILPLFLVPPGEPAISRSVWQGLRDSGAFFDVEKSLDRIHWATAEIRRFLEREEVRARELGVAIQRNRIAYKSNVPLENGLRDRVTHFDPRSLLEEAR